MSDRVLRALCVYCGSSEGKRPVYREAAAQLARRLAEQDIMLVYGGASVGLMGAVADTVLEAGGKACGIIPRALLEKEIAHQGLTELHVVGSMHERKMLMAEKSDGFVALPGGFGTLEEIIEVLTWGQLGFHRKPCGLLDVDGYYAPLLAYLDRAVGEGFVSPVHREMLLVDPEPAALLERFRRYRAPEKDKWWR